MTIKIMPLGASVTDGLTVPGGYRIELWNSFVAQNLSIDFVGSLSNGPDSLGDKDHEGHSGFRIDEIASSVDGWLNTQQPDIITLLIGANDLIENFDVGNAPARLSALIDQITNLLPDANLLVASIQPISEDIGRGQELAFNSTIPGIVAAKVAEGKKVTFVDVFSSLTLSDIADGIHPNEVGYGKIAQAWESAILSIPSLTPIASSLNDFNGDRTSDILWRNTATGVNTVWLMDGTNVDRDVAISSVADSNWSIGGTGDFNGDRTSDILWRNFVTGVNTVWLMDGTNVANDVLISPVADPNWSIGGTGDFNGDRTSDILWRNTATGVNTIWLMDGTSVANDVLISPVADPNWSIGGTGDFNGDRTSDILWRNTATGMNTIWMMNGTNVVQDVAIDSITYLEWSIGSTGDFNSDNQSDILWRNTVTGENTMWLMNGTNVAQSLDFSPVADINWQIGS